jgi:hypothetical protein
VAWGSPLGIAATTGLLYWPQMIDDGDCGTIGGMKIGRGDWSTRRKPAPMPLFPPDPGSNPGRRGGKPATNRLSYVTAVTRGLIIMLDLRFLYGLPCLTPCRPERAMNCTELQPRPHYSLLCSPELAFESNSKNQSKVHSHSWLL